MEEDAEWVWAGGVYMMSSCFTTNAITGFDDEYGSLSSVYSMTNLQTLIVWFGVTVL